MKTSLQVAALFCLQFAAIAQPAHMKSLHGSVPAAAAGLQPLRHLEGTNQLKLAIGLPLHNREALTNLLQRLYDPASPDYHHYLTPAQFTEKFGPTAQDYQAVIDFAKASGLKIAAKHDSRILLDVRGKAADMEKAFHVKLHIYQHPNEPRQFYAPDVEPSVDASLPIQDITGLSDYAKLRPALHKGYPMRKNIGPASGSAPDGVSYLGQDFRNAYAPGVSYTGAGQMVGLFEADGYYNSDITNYEALANLPNVPLTNVLIGGFNGSPGVNNDEVALDIEMAISMAPGLSGVIVFETPNNDSIASDMLTALDDMASSNQIKQFSSSWGYGGGSANTSFDTEFQKMATQGQSFFQASGDGDAWVGAIWTPADSPYLTSVGGTSLTMNGTGASYNSETVWNEGHLNSDISQPWFANGASGYWGSGGGVSTVYSIPPWQTNTANLGSTTMRNIPDVALTAEHVWVIYDNGSSNWFMGTSCAAPLWAGFMALVNQQAVTNGIPTAGFINPAIYALGQGSTYTSCFNDITTGNNEWSGSSTEFSAVSGYDLCTGWGTPNGTTLINALTETPINEFNFVTNAGVITITGYTGSNGIVTIPGTINSLTVANIAASAFAGLTNLTNVTIPSGVTNIGSDAFQNCSNLSVISLDANVAGIGSHAFQNCVSLTGVTLGANVTSIGTAPFDGCSSLTSITVNSGNSFYSSLSGVLYNASQTTLIEYPGGLSGSYPIPATVTSIGTDAFADCAGLTGVTFTSSVTSIGAAAFTNCTGLTSLTIPASIASIGDDAFENCTSLASVYFNGNAPSADSTVFIGDSTTLYYLPGTTGWSNPFAGRPADDEFACTTNNGVITITNYYGMGGAVTIPTNINGIPVAIIGNGSSPVFGNNLTSVIIPAGITNIADYAFENCPSLASVMIGDTVTNIGDFAFNGCTSLSDITLGANVASIGEEAFFNCDVLTNVTIPDSVTNIGMDAFASTGLTSVTIPASVTSIGDFAFASTSLTNAYFEGNAPSANQNVFAGDDNAPVYYLPGATGWGSTFGGDTTMVWIQFTYTTNAGVITLVNYTGLGGAVTLPTNVTSLPVATIGNGASPVFSASLTNVTIPAGITNIAAYAFQNCSNLTNVTLGNTINNIGAFAFNNCSSLTNIAIGSNVTRIGDDAFQNCSNLANLIIPNSVTNLGNAAFQSCFSLTNVTLGTNVATIGNEAFQGCASLTNIAIGSNVTSIGAEAFAGCINMPAITVAAKNMIYSSVNGVLFDKAQDMLLEYPAGLENSYTIPAGVTSIAAGAFADTSLTNVTIPGNVTSIGTNAFASCSNLTAIYLTSNAPAVAPNAFDFDSRATVYYLPGTSGWGSTFGGAPAMLLNPPVPNGSLQVIILPGTVLTNGAQWQVDGGIPQASGAVVLGLAVGSHTVTFSAISGYASPTEEIVFVSANTTTTIGAEYAVIVPAGSLQVMLLPASVITAGAQWRVDGASHLSGEIVTNLLVGSHTVSFTTIPGLNTPANQTVTIADNETTTTTGVYTFMGVSSSGALNVTLLPAVTEFLGATWQVDGGPSQNTGATVSNLLAGSHTVSFTPIADWNSPPNQTVTIKNGVTAMASGIYTISNAPGDGLTLITNGAGTIQHAAWPAQLVNNRTYKVTAAPKAKNVFTGWTGGTSQPYSALSTNFVYQFTMEPNLVLEANFQANIFLTAQGTYKGLFAPANLTRQQDDSGSFSFTLTSGRAVSGSLALGRQTVPFSGKFDIGGAAEIVQNRELPLTMSLQLDFADQSVSGTLITSAFTAAMNGYRDAGNAEGLAGSYTFVIPGTNDASAGPFGVSYGTVKVSSLGTVTLTGSLADGTSISQSSAISQDGYWPFYVSLYGGQGSLWGWNYLTADSGISPVPFLSWINATNAAKTAVYRSGFTNQTVTFTGELYTPGQLLPMGLIATLQENNQPATMVTNLSALSLKFNKTTGVISGSFANPDEPTKKIKFNGVMLQNETEVEGYFLGTNQSGEFILDSP